MNARQAYQWLHCLPTVPADLSKANQSPEHLAAHARETRYRVKQEFRQSANTAVVLTNQLYALGGVGRYIDALQEFCSGRICGRTCDTSECCTGKSEPVSAFFVPAILVLNLTSLVILRPTM